MEKGIKEQPSPDILKKLSGPLGISYEELMVKAGYWSEGYDEEDRQTFERIYNEEATLASQISEVLKSLVDEDGIFPDEMHEDVFEILGERLTLTADGEWSNSFDEWFSRLIARNPEDIDPDELDEAKEEFNKFYNFTSVKGGLQAYQGSKSLGEFLQEFLDLADKRGIKIGEHKTQFTNIDLSDILPDKSVIVRFRNKRISLDNRHRLIGYIEALTTSDNTEPDN